MDERTIGIAYDFFVGFGEFFFFKKERINNISNTETNFDKKIPRMNTTLFLSALQSIRKSLKRMKLTKYSDTHTKAADINTEKTLLNNLILYAKEIIKEINNPKRTLNNKSSANK